MCVHVRMYMCILYIYARNIMYVYKFTCVCVCVCDDWSINIHVSLCRYVIYFMDSQSVYCMQDILNGESKLL